MNAACEVPLIRECAHVTITYPNLLPPHLTLPTGWCALQLLECDSLPGSHSCGLTASASTLATFTGATWTYTATPSTAPRQRDPSRAAAEHSQRSFPP